MDYMELLFQWKHNAILFPSLSTRAARRHYLLFPPLLKSRRSRERQFKPRQLTFPRTILHFDETWFEEQHFDFTSLKTYFNQVHLHQRRFRQFNLRDPLMERVETLNLCIGVNVPNGTVPVKTVEGALHLECGQRDSFRGSVWNLDKEIPFCLEAFRFRGKKDQCKIVDEVQCKIVDEVMFGGRLIHVTQ
jgi:hypothetical protein